MKKQTIKLNESQLRNIIKESIKKVLNEAAFSPNYPANTINNTIWANYNLPWNKVDDTPEQYKGIWYITVDFFDYTEHMGTVEIDRQFKSLEDCLNYAQNISIYEVEELCNEEITDEGFSSISLNIMCQSDNGVLYEVANTKMYMPKE